MAKGDDSVMRKKNKARRKKLNNKNDSSTVSARIASIIAAKKRRKSGKRRMCQGMCFSLPTPDDPFNEMLGKMDFSKKERKKKDKKRTPVSANGSVASENAKAIDLKVNDNKMVTSRNYQKETVSFFDFGVENPLCKKMDCPSKFLMLCLNEIENSLRSEGIYGDLDEKHLFMSSWGVEFWRCFLSGKDVLETSGASSATEQIVWIVSMAADAMARKEKEGLSVSSPFLVFLVPSQEKAAKVRSVCKPLKSLGIHSVSLHPGASLDHQVNGLKSCEPEFLVSTPERLLELVSLRGIDISGVSLLQEIFGLAKKFLETVSEKNLIGTPFFQNVVDELDSLCRGGHLNAVKSIKQAISGQHQTVVFNDSLYCASISAVQSLLVGSISRISLNDSVASQSVCITQSVHVCASNEEKLLKCAEALDSAYGSNRQSKSSKVLYVVRKDGNFQQLMATLKIKGYSISSSENCKVSEIKRSERPAAHLIDIEQTSTVDLGEYEVVIIPDFVPSTEMYVQILTRMARYSVNGVLKSFLSVDNASQAEHLLRILEECGQAVPKDLRKLCLTSSSSMMES